LAFGVDSAKRADEAEEGSQLARPAQRCETRRCTGQAEPDLHDESVSPARSAV